jgi:hypothetical protein
VQVRVETEVEVEVHVWVQVQLPHCVYQLEGVARNRLSLEKNSSR